MKKHSRASLVALVFSEEGKHLKINYSDNGEGTTSQAIQNGNGLKNVENRILSVNGKLTFETEKGKIFFDSRPHKRRDKSIKIFKSLHYGMLYSAGFR